MQTTIEETLAMKATLFSLGRFHVTPPGRRAFYH